ncbi:MAG: hypothetical protein PHH11_14320 [Methylomonas sp.]|nr:hypothetical protein [Methylomonas sp.]
MDEDSLKGLIALPLKFPRKCNNCGREYVSETDFLLQTRDMSSGRSSLKQAEDERGQVIVEVYRNCVCGSTMMDMFQSRRDVSEEGIRRREEYDRLSALGKTHAEIIEWFRSNGSVR